MKHTGLVLLLLAGSAAAADVGVSVNVSQPGFFGQINIGDVPQPPAVIYARPVTVAPPAVAVGGPIYLHVPPGYERHWSHHCGEYSACGRPVYFVREDWYQREYVPRHPHHDEHEYRDRHDEGWHGEHGHDRDGDHHDHEH